MATSTIPKTDQAGITMLQQVSDIEALVTAACSRGVEPSRCWEAIDDAVRRARRKGAMLPRLDSSLWLSTIEQAKCEVASLSDVTDTNAQVMQEELLHHQEREEEQAGSDTAAASVLSNPGSSGTPRQLSSVGTSREEGCAPEDVRDASSPRQLAPGTPALRAVHLQRVSLTAAEAVAPLRDFATEVAAAAEAEGDEDRSFRKSMNLRTSKSGDFRLAKAYDFETAQSPRASYHKRDQPFRFTPGRYAAGEGGSGSGSPAYRQVGFGGGSPLARQSGDRQAGAFSNAEGVTRTPQGQSSSGSSDEDTTVVLERLSAGGRPQPVSFPRSPPSTPASRQGRSTPPASLYGRSGGDGGQGRCWAGAPPGLNPTAEVEGSFAAYYEEERELIDPHSPTGVGDVDLASYTNAPFTLHSVTPPRRVMAELAAEVMGRLRM